ncbi:MAG: sugar-binding protein [Chloroflexota bacterium]
MSYQPGDFDDTWAGLEPEPPPPAARPWLVWLGVAAAVFLLVGACLIGGYLVLRRFQQPAAPPATVAVPTVVGEVDTAVPEQPTATPPAAPTTAIAPTATLAASPTTSVTPSPLTPSPQPTLLGQVEAAHLTNPPTIDGDLLEWTPFSPVESAFQVYSAADWDGSDDVQAFWRLGWDENYLYVAVEVVDDRHVQTQTGNQIFRGDSVDMQIDTDRPGDFAPRLSSDDFQFILSPGDFGPLPPSAFRFQGKENGQIVDAPGGHHVILAARPSAAGYTIEAAIPWTDLNITPTAGLVMGLALNVNDNDRPDQAVQEVMKSHVSTRTLTDPTGWGTLRLSDE